MSVDDADTPPTEAPEPTEATTGTLAPEPVDPAVDVPPLTADDDDREVSVYEPVEDIAENTPELPAEAEDVVASAEPEPEPEPVNPKKWYVVKVTSNREESIKAAIERRVKIEGLEEFFGQIVIPVERTTVIKKVKETKNGEKVTKEKRVIKEEKKYPGYIMAEVEWNDRILYLFRETSGVGDFVGAPGPNKPPPPMTDIEVRRMLGEPVGKDDGKGGKDGGPTVIKLDYDKGDKVRIREGMFANTEGDVKEIVAPKEAGETPRVVVVVTVFGRPVDVDLDYWQVDKV